MVGLDKRPKTRFERGSLVKNGYGICIIPIKRIGQGNDQGVSFPEIFKNLIMIKH